MRTFFDKAVAALAPYREADPPIQIDIGNIKPLIIDLLKDAGMVGQDTPPLVFGVIAAATPFRIDLDRLVTPAEVEAFLANNAAIGMWYMFGPYHRYRFSDETTACLFRLNFG